MESLKSESLKGDEIVSPSLVLKPPEDYNCKDFLCTELLSIFDEEPENAVTPATKAVTNENPPVNKKPRLSLSLKKHKDKANFVGNPVLKEKNCSASESASNRFSFVASDEMIKKATNGVVPVNTEYSTHWAEKNFLFWAENRNKKTPNDPVPMDLLHSHDPELVCKHLCCFVMETRKENGELYPFATVRSLLCGLNRILKANNAPFSIFDKADSRFHDLLNTIDSVSSELHKKGVGSQKKQSQVITREDEDTL